MSFKKNPLIFDASRVCQIAEIWGAIDNMGYG